MRTINMKQTLRIALVLLLIAGFIACKKDKETVAVTVPLTSVGISFSAAKDTVDLNKDSGLITIAINISDSISKAELEERLKLNFTTSTEVTDSLVRIKSMVITENPLTVTVQLQVLPNLERVSRDVKVSFDESMQPIELGTNPTFTLTVLPFSPAATWFKTDAYYAPYFYYLNAEGSWTSIPGHFPVLVDGDAAALGFVNNYVANSGVAFFNMVRIYTSEIGSNNIKTAKINVPNAIEFIPASAGARTGVVNVIPQDVVVTRKDSTTFKIGISGTGTYDLDTKLIEMQMIFNDAAIGGGTSNPYSYKISVDKLTF